METSITFSLLVALAATGAPSHVPDGNRVLARAAATGGELRSYTVPVHFDVRLHKPLGIKFGVDGTMYFKEPARSVLVMTKRPPIIGGLFAQSYELDLVPQTWPAKYTVTAVSTAQFNGIPVYVLSAVPKIAGTVDHVIFQVEQANFAPVSAQWFYRDQSTIAISIANRQIGNHVLPGAEAVEVAMPRYALAATSTFGQYAFNVQIPDSVFPPDTYQSSPPPTRK
jgi:hypothetical protein